MNIRTWLAAGIWAAGAGWAGAFPTAIHQQGRLLDGTNLYTGAATVVFRLYDVLEGGAALAGSTNDVTVVDGLYAATLDLAPAEWAAVLTNAELYLETEINATPLAPRERIGAAAYAWRAAGVTNGAIGELQLADNAVTKDKLLDGAVTTDKLGPGAVTLDKLGGNSVNSGKIADGSVTADDVEANAFWRTDGNTAVASGSFIGTTDGASFEIRCRDEAVYRADTPLTMAGTTIRMGRSNTVAFAPGGVLAGGFLNRIGDNNYNVVLGGGTLNIINDEASASVLAGGYSNSIGTHAYQSTLSGGLGNMIGTVAEMAVIAGGEMNAAWGSRGTIGGGASNEVSGARSVVSGGSRNRALAADAAIGGGTGNVATNTASRGTIGGGQNNLAAGGGSTVGGGDNNRALAINATVGGGNGNVASAIIATIGGGINNRATTESSTVGGGANNFAGGGSGWATVAGGSGNQATGSYATVAGGSGNVAQRLGFVGGGDNNQMGMGGAYEVIAGGEDHTIEASQTHDTIGGGKGNWITASYNTIAGGASNTLYAPYGFIGGGLKNFSQGQYGVVAGGGDNYVDGNFGAIGGGWDNYAAGAATVAGGISNVASAGYGAIGGGASNAVAELGGVVAGGARNRALAAGAAIGGGDGNVVSNGANQSVVGGGANNAICEDAAHGVIAGGQYNTIFTNSSYGVVGGGKSNMVIGEGSMIGGGTENVSLGNYTTIAGGWGQGIWGMAASIGGGWDNFAAGGATVAGGMSNVAWGTYSAIPGGFSNLTSGAYSFAGGRRANADHDGAFVWADSTDEEFASTTNDQFSVRAAGGAQFVGSTNLGSLTVSPLHTGADQDAQIYLTEGESGTYGMYLKYDGGVNRFQIFGKYGTNIYGPHLVVARNTNAAGLSAVGIGRTPTTYELEVEGDASKTTASGWKANSDARIKTDVRTIEGALDTLLKLRPVAFRYTAEHRAKHPSIEDRDYNNFIAQEYREVFPAAVKEDGEGLLMVDTYDVQPYLVRAAQELAAAVDELRKENAELRARIEALEAGR